MMNHDTLMARQQCPVSWSARIKPYNVWVLCCFVRGLLTQKLRPLVQAASDLCCFFCAICSTLTSTKPQWQHGLRLQRLQCCRTTPTSCNTFDKYRRGNVAHAGPRLRLQVLERIILCVMLPSLLPVQHDLPNPLHSMRHSTTNSNSGPSLHCWCKAEGLTPRQGI